MKNIRRILKCIILVNLMVSGVCQAELVYLAKVNFAGKIFNDILVLEKPIKEGGKIKGSLTVPGQFTTSFLAERMSHQPMLSINFTTKAIENGNELIIKGFLKGNSSSSKKLIGYLDVSFGEGKEVIRAPLAAELIYQDKK